MELHLNTEMINRSGISARCKVAQACLKPYRYLFDGKTVEIFQGRIVQARPSFPTNPIIPETGMHRTALAVIGLVPGLIVGITLRIVSILMGDDKQSRSLIEQFYQRRLVLPEIPPGVSLDQFHRGVAQQRIALLNRIGSDRAIWQDPQFIQEFSALMENAYRYSEIYFRQLYQECSGDPQTMVDRMLLKPESGRLGNRQDYYNTFSYLPTLYYFARGCITRADESKREVLGLNPNERMPMKAAVFVSEIEQRPYFDPSAPQYRWRELHNAFCAKLDQLNLRPLLNARHELSQLAERDLRLISHFKSRA